MERRNNILAFPYSVVGIDSCSWEEVLGESRFEEDHYPHCTPCYIERLKMEASENRWPAVPLQTALGFLCIAVHDPCSIEGQAVYGTIVREHSLQARKLEGLLAILNHLVFAPDCPLLEQPSAQRRIHHLKELKLLPLPVIRRLSSSPQDIA